MHVYIRASKVTFLSSRGVGDISIPTIQMVHDGAFGALLERLYMGSLIQGQEFSLTRGF
jgi:hypothetical protein